MGLGCARGAELVAAECHHQLFLRFLEARLLKYHKHEIYMGSAERSRSNLGTFTFLTVRRYLESGLTQLRAIILPCC
jgi:hypothetical protein